MPNTLPCESDLSYTYLYTVNPAITGSGSSEAAAKQAALTNVPNDTNDKAQQAARTDAETNQICGTGCGRDINLGDVTFVATAAGSGTTWTASIAGANVPVTIHCRKPKLASISAPAIDIAVRDAQQLGASAGDLHGTLVQQALSAQLAAGNDRGKVLSTYVAQLGTQGHLRSEEATAIMAIVSLVTGPKAAAEMLPSLRLTHQDLVNGSGTSPLALAIGSIALDSVVAVLAGGSDTVANDVAGAIVGGLLGSLFGVPLVGAVVGAVILSSERKAE
jgi:hypothetical protein